MCNAANTVRIIGIGSPIEGDTLGLELVDAMQHQPEWQQLPLLEWLLLERPGASLLSYFDGADTVCLVDALAGNKHQGIVEIAAEALMLESGAVSSHLFGVAEALRLAQSLNQLPPRLLIFGVGRGEQTALLNELSQRLHESLYSVSGVKTQRPAKYGR